MPIDLGQVDWLYVFVLAVFVFVATVLANLLPFKRWWFAATVAAALFTVTFVFWTYYPHGLPLPTSATNQKPAAVTGAPVVPVAPVAREKPRNPVTDISPAPGTSR
jgi:membrane protein implicated in regulation of membrane protease activity